MAQILRHIICFCGLVIVQTASCQVNTSSPNYEQFEEITDQLDFDQTKRALRLRPKYEKMLNEEEESDLEQTPRRSLGLGGLMEILAYALIIVLILLILYLIISNSTSDVKIDEGPAISTEIEDIEVIDSRSGYDEAVARGDYRSAIRMQFILVLQHLSDHDKIDWQPDKTNRDYARELRSSIYHTDFRQLSNIYEWVWYGHTEITEPVFHDINRYYIDFISQYIDLKTSKA